MSILIVESPAKCKKIQSFLDKSYIVKSSVGHIRTLDTKWANTDVKINIVPETRTDIETKRVGSVSKLKKLGWNMNTDMEKGIRKTWEWINSD